LQNVRRNREDLKELCEKIKEIVEILRAQVAANGATLAVKLKGVCEEFERSVFLFSGDLIPCLIPVRFLQEMLVVVAKMQAETEGFRGHLKGFIKSSSISTEIAGYEKRIQELISNINVCLFHSVTMTRF